MIDRIHSKIAGVTFDDRQALLRALKEGQILTLVREPENLHDKNAIKILSKGLQIGFIRAPLAAELAPAMDQGMRYFAKVSEITGGDDKNLGCNIEIISDVLQSESGHPDQIFRIKMKGGDNDG